MTSTRWKPAATVAAIVERDGRFLMIEEETPEGLRWNQPAGHLEPGESLLDAVVREVREESAHDFAALGLMGVYLAPAAHETYLRFAFVGTVGQALDLPLDEPIRRVFWADAHTLYANRKRIRSPQVLACVNDYWRARRDGTPWLPLSAVSYLFPGEWPQSLSSFSSTSAVRR